MDRYQVKCWKCGKRWAENAASWSDVAKDHSCSLEYYAEHPNKFPTPVMDCIVSARRIQGRVNPKIKCGIKCHAAIGHICECSCGGINHGGNLAA